MEAPFLEAPVITLTVTDVDGVDFIDSTEVGNIAEVDGMIRSEGTLSGFLVTVGASFGVVWEEFGFDSVCTGGTAFATTGLLDLGRGTALELSDTIGSAD